MARVPVILLAAGIVSLTPLAGRRAPGRRAATGRATGRRARAAPGRPRTGAASEPESHLRLGRDDRRCQRTGRQGVGARRKVPRHRGVGLPRLHDRVREGRRTWRRALDRQRDSGRENRVSGTPARSRCGRPGSTTCITARSRRRPLTPTTTQLVYSLFFDNSQLADDAAREANIASRRKTFTAS